MIIGTIKNISNQLNFIGIKYINRIIDTINNTDFSKIEDGEYHLQGDNLFYILSTYKTSTFSEEKVAEVHRKYIDLQYIIFGEEKFGFADYSSIKVCKDDYDPKEDVELFTRIEDESFITFKKGMYAIFFPEDIHRPGLTITETRQVRKVIFKILI